MPLPVRNGVQNTAPYLINDPAIPQPATYAVFQQGGYHALDFLDDGTENSLYGIKRHHRAWDMLVAIKQNRITYKLVDGHYNSDIMDNRNWKVWKDDNQSTTITNSGGLAPWDAQEAAAGEYDTDEFVGHNGTIWRSTVDNNLSEPGTDASWEESSLDRLAHQRNKDTGLMTAAGVFFSLDQVLDLIASKIAKTALDLDIALDNSDEKVATSKAVKSYVDSLIANALRNPKPFDASTATTFPVGVAGDTYRVTAPGTVQGTKLQAGDLLFTDKPNAGAVAEDWYAIQSNVDQATQAVIGLLRLATEQETIDETLSDVAVSPFTLGRWFGNVLTRAGIYFRETVAVLGLQLGSLTTAGSTRTIEARGSAADVSIELKVQGNGKLKTNALAHAGTDTLVAAGTDGTLKDTGLDPAKISLIADLSQTAFVSKGGNDATGLAGRIDKPFATVQAAINGLTASSLNSGKIVVGPGVYTENLNQNSRHHLTIDLTGGAVLETTLTVNGHGLNLVSSDRTGRFVGQLVTAYNLRMNIMGLVSLESPDVLMKARYGALTYIKDVQTIKGTGQAVSTLFEAGSYWIQNVRSIIQEDGDAIFNNVGAGGNSSEIYLLENIGLIQCKEGTISTTANYYEVRNVTFHSPLKNFYANFGNFSHTRFKSDLYHCAEFWSGGEVRFGNCQFQSGAGYAIASSGKITYDDTIRNCPHFNHPSYTPVLRLGSDNTYDSDFVITPQY